MSEIKSILDTIASISGKNDKRAELLKHSDNELLKEVLYKANSPRVKFWVKQIPEYQYVGENNGLDWALSQLEKLSTREFTGGDAINHLQWILGSISVDNQDIIKRVVKKDLKIGMDTGINDVIPNLIEETPYMGAKSFSEKGAKKLFEKGKKVYSQVKMDGTYRNAIIMGGQVELVSRQGEVSVLNGAPFLDELATMNDCVLNGELTIDGFERYEANGMVSSIMDILKKEEERGEKETAKKIAEFEIKHGSFTDAISKMRYTIWDMVTIDEYFDKFSKRRYLERFDCVVEKLTWTDKKFNQLSLVETKIVESYTEAMDHFLDTQNRGLEGTIIKSADGEWKDGKPTYQIKMKLEMNIDLKIIEFIYGNEGTKNENVISRLKVQSSCGLLTTQPSGMNEAMMKYVTEHQDELMGTIVEVRCCGLSQNERGEWSLLHPSVVELRSDKNSCDSLETATEIQNMAKGLTKLLS
jgi:DNA ligase-1